MCGACGSDRGAADWARPFLAGLPARSAVASAVLRLLGPAGPRVQARGGGWLVRTPTGAMTDCAGLGELVAALSRWLGAPSDFGVGREAPPSGRLVVPPPDARRGVRLVVDPVAAPRPLVEWADVVVVADPDSALRVLDSLSRPPWSVRRYLEEISGATEGWASAPAVVRAPAAEYAADLLVWVELGRRSGLWDSAAVLARCPLDSGGAELQVEVRAGHVVRAGVV